MARTKYEETTWEQSTKNVSKEIKGHFDLFTNKEISDLRGEIVAEVFNEDKATISSYGNSTTVEIKGYDINQTKIFFDGKRFSSFELLDLLKKNNFREDLIKYANFLNLLKNKGFKKMYGKHIIDNGWRGKKERILYPKDGKYAAFSGFANSSEIKEYIETHFYYGTSTLKKIKTPEENYTKNKINSYFKSTSIELDMKNDKLIIDKKLELDFYKKNGISKKFLSLDGGNINEILKIYGNFINYMKSKGYEGIYTRGGNYKMLKPFENDIFKVFAEIDQVKSYIKKNFYGDK